MSEHSPAAHTDRPAAPPLALVTAAVLGGALGACLRAGLGELLPDSTGAGPLVATWLANVVGCALLAWLAAAGVLGRRPWWEVALGPGVLGGFTTLSLWAEQTRALLGQDEPQLAMVYALGTTITCLGVVALVRRACGAHR